MRRNRTNYPTEIASNNDATINTRDIQLARNERNNFANQFIQKNNRLERIRYGSLNGTIRHRNALRLHTLVENTDDSNTDQTQQYVNPTSTPED